MAGLKPYSGSQFMLESLAMREPTKKPNREPSHSNRKSPLTLRRTKSTIYTFIDNYTIVTQKTKSLGKPWETLATVGLISRHLERAEAVAHLCLTTGHDFLGVYLNWLLTRPAHSANMPE
ncbi:hypothetical protein TNCV_3614481 [Trichonephila clavipes]|uniref:Uncharacterized protein n=1 Tax=Trichonephila clavipes TaxID=2585209 RepID=A0A8X6VND7_TRICX|nr:hypothetical protein TNCV_3614481 [Trichonephila clavipes]